MGDYNGDGKTDFLIPQVVNEDNWSFFMSNGLNFNTVNKPIGLNYVQNQTGYYGVVGFSYLTQSLVENTYIPTDINGDGKTDIIYNQNLTVEFEWDRDGNQDYTYQDTPQGNVLVLFENQSSNSNNISFTQTITNCQSSDLKRNAIPVFTNNSTASQIPQFSLLSNNLLRAFKSQKDNKTDMLLREIINGNVVKETITYKTLKNDNCGNYCNSVYNTSLNTAFYPNIDIGETDGFHVVSKIEKQSKTVY